MPQAVDERAPLGLNEPSLSAGALAAMLCINGLATTSRSGGGQDARWPRGPSSPRRVFDRTGFFAQDDRIEYRATTRRNTSRTRMGAALAEGRRIPFASSRASLR